MVISYINLIFRRKCVKRVILLLFFLLRILLRPVRCTLGSLYKLRWLFNISWKNRRESLLRYVTFATIEPVVDSFLDNAGWRFSRGQPGSCTTSPSRQPTSLRAGNTSILSTACCASHLTLDLIRHSFTVFPVQCSIGLYHHGSYQSCD